MATKTVKITKTNYSELTFDDVFEALSWLQANVKVEKGGQNSFNNSKYYRTEDILKGLKPYISRIKGLVLLPPKIEAGALPNGTPIKTAIYTLRYKDKDGEVTTVDVNDFVMLNNNPKMTEEQVSGSASTYAKKYALQSMFMLDDDVDTDYTSSNFVGEGGDYKDVVDFEAKRQEQMELEKQTVIRLKVAKNMVKKWGATETQYKEWLQMEVNEAIESMRQFDEAQKKQQKGA